MLKYTKKKSLLSILNNIYIIFMVLVSICGFSQNKEKVFITYPIENANDLDLSRSHKLIMGDDYICILQPRFGLFPEQRYFFSFIKKDSIIFLKNRHDNNSYETRKCIENPLIEQFINSHIQMISQNELLLLGEKRPYYSEKYIKQVLGYNYFKGLDVLFLDNQIVTEDSHKIQKYLKKNMNKIDFKMNYLKGKDAIAKYGAKGLFGVLEIYCTTKK